MARHALRIGSGLGFYGDRWAPVRATVKRGEVQYIGSDHLAELTLAIMAKDRARDPRGGYARDIAPMLANLWPEMSPRGVRFISNAGGLNPQGAVEAIASALRKTGQSARIAMVEGEGLLDRLDEPGVAGALVGLDPDSPLDAVRERLVFTNAYLGAAPIVSALEMGADIVVTGRVADAALFLAPAVFEFGWRWDDWDRLASGVMVGHLLECSGQASGGNLGGRQWRDVPDFAHLGFPIADVRPSGEALLTKPPGTGGRVDFDTVRQQLLYEVHDPACYVTPDVVLDLTTVEVRDQGDDKVALLGARGKPRPESLKVVGGYGEGWLGQIRCGYAWPDAADKARVAEQIIGDLAAKLGLGPGDLYGELQGVNSLMGLPMDPALEAQLNEVYLRVAARCASRSQADAFARLFTFLALSGPPGMSGFQGVEPARELLGLWTGLVDRRVVETGVRVELLEV